MNKRANLHVKVSVLKSKSFLQRSKNDDYVGRLEGRAKVLIKAIKQLK